jgi:uncharacterized SAM-binding protein YcdF (DUF218 family)
MDFLYNLFLKLLCPTSVCLMLLLLSAVLKKFKVLSRVCFWLAVSTLLVCGNGWVVRAMTEHLEQRHLPPDPLPEADCILVLSGGISARIPPRPTLEVMEAGDRILHAANLFRQGKAPSVICTGDVATGGLALRPAAEDMADFLETLGVPRSAVVKETRSRNTHEHACRLLPVFRERGDKRVLLVTSAMHMPRAFGTFRRRCPGVEFVPAPTDFRMTKRIPSPWYHEIKEWIPTPGRLLLFSEAIHEYLGLLEYRVRGWM